MHFPKVRLDHDSSEDFLRAIECAFKTVQEPFEPWRDVEAALLRCFENVVVSLPLFADLRRHAVEALSIFLRTRKREIGDGACDPAIAVVAKAITIYAKYAVIKVYYPRIRRRITLLVARCS